MVFVQHYVLHVDRDIEINALGLEELSCLILSLGFDPQPVYVPLDREKHDVDIATIARDL